MNKRDHPNQTKLMVSGLIRLKPDLPSVEVRRGMAIVSREGFDVGKVAAVLLDGGDGEASYVLLGRLPRIQEYRLILPDLIEQVVDEEVRIKIVSQSIEDLPIWHSELN